MTREGDARSETRSTYVVRLTPKGRGAIATLLVDGPKAASIVGACLTEPAGSLEDNRLIVRHFGGSSGEQVVIRRRSAMSIELHCHGGRAAVDMIENVLVKRGACRIDWRRWSKAVAPDSITAIVSIALADARTARTASILLDQYNGALQKAFDTISKAFATQDFGAVEKMVSLLLSRADLTRHLTDPWRVVVAGRANAGKSSLVNAILGYDRAIVHHRPGTTRDVVTAETALDGWPVVLIDTAGLRSATEPIESLGVQLASNEARNADLVILVFDAAEPWSTADKSLMERYPRAIVVYTKVDIATDDQARPPGLRTSAVAKYGIEELSRVVSERLVPKPPHPRSPVLITEDQIGSLVDVANAMSCHDPIAGAKLFEQVINGNRVA